MRDGEEEANSKFKRINRRIKEVGIGLVGIFIPFNMILLTISLVDKFLKLNLKVASQVSLT